MLILFSGVPCSGKSTLAMQTAEHLRVPYFSRDSLQSFLSDQNLVDGNTIDAYQLLFTLAEEQAKLNISMVLDAVFGRQFLRDEVLQISERQNIVLKPIYCHMSDNILWKERWERRQSSQTLPDWMTPNWDDILNIKNNFQAWETVDILSVDAVNPMEKNFKLVKDYLNR